MLSHVYSIPDLSALICNIKDCIVCSGFGQSISHSRENSYVVIMSFFYRNAKQKSKLVGRS